MLKKCPGIPTSTDIIPYITQLQEVCYFSSGGPQILGGDFNCRSTLWFNNKDDHRSPALIDFVAVNGLDIVNEPGNPFTFNNNFGCSNIDLTLISEALTNKVSQWKVTRETTSSDHRLISFTLSLSKDHEPPQTTTSYQLDYSNITHEMVENDMTDICSFLMGKFPILVSPSKIDLALGFFYKCTEEILNIHARRRKRFDSRPDWWNEKVEKRRQLYLACKSRLYKNKDENLTEALFQKMREAMESFTETIKAEKERS
jgi:hypothetical protein